MFIICFEFINFVIVTHIILPLYTDSNAVNAKRPRRKARSLAVTDRRAVVSEILAMTCACKVKCSFVLHTKVTDIVDLVKVCECVYACVCACVYLFFVIMLQLI